MENDSSRRTCTGSSRMDLTEDVLHCEYARGRTRLLLVGESVTVAVLSSEMLQGVQVTGLLSIVVIITSQR